MKDKYTPGQDCGCYAYSESECGCGADWTPSEVYELREKLDTERALADQLAESLKELLYYDLQDVNLGRLKSSREALTAWKEARSEI